ncbi:MAG: radical SAM protein [Candidatus Aenigmatarchaeota archaeon]
MIDPEKRSELLRPRMMKDGKFLITRIGGSVQEADQNKILDNYFRYKNYISGDNEFEEEWMTASLKDVWSTKFLGLVDNLWSRPLKEIKKLEYQNPQYAAAFRFDGRKGDPRDYNKVFAAQVSGCTYACNFCYVPPEINAAAQGFGKFFSASEIVDNFLSVKKESKEPMNVIRLTGGETTIIPEIILDVFAEIEKRGLKIYLWIDTNLSTSTYLERIEGDLRDVFKKNAGVVGCFKGVSKEDFFMITGSKPQFYENQFETAKLLLSWKADTYIYLPGLIYGKNYEKKAESFIQRLRDINKNLPLRLEMLIIKEYPGAVINIEQKKKEGRPLPETDQKAVFNLWYNKLLPRIYSEKMLRKFGCEVPL